MVKKYYYPSAFTIIEDGLKLFDSFTDSDDLLTKLYFRDSELLFLIVYTARIIYMSSLEQVFTYNTAYEDPAFIYDPIHEHIYLQDVEVSILRTRNKIYSFGYCSGDPNYKTEELLLSEDGKNMNSPLAIKTFKRWGIKSPRNFRTLMNKIENHYKKSLNSY